MERYIAIDNVCAWPNLTTMPGGDIIATIFNQPTHGGWEGDVERWSGGTDGRFWTLRGVPAPHEPTTNRMNVAAGCARDGSLVVLASGWSKRNPVGDYSSPHKGEVLPMWVCRSEDAGQTWTHAETIKAPSDNEAIIPFGDVVQLSDGTLGVSVYGWTSEGKCASYFYSSDDDGRTWAIRSTISPTEANETALVTLNDGRILAAVRRTGGAHMDMFISDDNGATWRGVGPVSLPSQHPGHLLELADGRILLTMGLRNRGYRGIGVRSSSDRGETWGAPIFLVELRGAGDLGYPASVQTADGTIVTAYYCDGITEHTRYHMGVMRWTLDENGNVK